jgi:transposase-like protein
MTKTNMDLTELLQKQDQGDFLRTVAEAVLQLLMEADVEGLIGAGRHERAENRTTWRNGYRERTLDTRLGTLNLKVPKLRQGSYFPSFLEARKMSEQALVAVIQEAWIGGVSTRRVDDLVQAMGLSGISKSTVSKLCKDIDERVSEFLNRPLTGEWPYVWLDATYLKQRQGGRIVSVAAIIAVAANTEGRREIIGLGIGPSEAETFWTDFLRSLRARGLDGVRLVISDAHTASRLQSRGSSTPPGSVVGFTGCAMHWSMSRKASTLLSPPPFVRHSTSRIDCTPARRGGTSPINCDPAGPSSRNSWTRANMMCWPIWRSPASIAQSSIQRIRLSV